MEAETLAPRSGLQQLVVDRSAVSALLVTLGVDISHPLLPAFIQGATDVLLAAEVAGALPECVSFDRALDGLASLDPRHNETSPPAIVVEVQLQVLEAVQEWAPAEHVLQHARLATLRARLRAFQTRL